MRKCDRAINITWSTKKGAKEHSRRIPWTIFSTQNSVASTKLVATVAVASSGSQSSLSSLSLPNNCAIVAETLAWCSLEWRATSNGLFSIKSNACETKTNQAKTAYQDRSIHKNSHQKSVTYHGPQAVWMQTQTNGLLVQCMLCT